MRTFLLSILLVVPWLFSSAQETTLELGFETQEAFDTNWVQVGNETQWTWLNYQAGTTSIVPVAQLDVVAPIPEKGTILAYKQGFNMKAGTGKASLNMRCGDYKKRAFEIVIATDNQFNNIVATVSYYVNGKNFGDKPMGNQYQPNTFEIPTNGTYYVGFRMISQYDDVVTVEGIMMVRHLSLTYVPFVAPTPSACTNLAVESKSTESTLASELTWTWPTTDSEGNALSEVGAYIYRSTTEEGIVDSQNLINTIECATQTGTGTYSDANITEPGTYYYTVVPFSANGASAIAPEVVSANIEYFDASAPISLDEAYTNSFDTEDALNGYSINPEGWNFTAANGYIHLNGGAFAAVTSALNTPAFAMQEGVEYSVTFNAWITSGNGHNVVLKAGNSPENLVAVGEAVNVTANNSAEPQKVQFIVTGNAEGKVYLAIEGTAASRATLYVDELVVEKYVAPELVISLDEAYTNSFDTEDALNGYTINPEGWNFTASNGYIHLNGGAFAAVTSALNTPAFAMQEGVEYSVTFNAWITSGNGHNVVLKAGNSPENLVAVGEAVNVTANNSAEPQKVQFIVTGNAEGKVYLAIEGTAASRATLNMDELVVEKYVAPELVISLD
ncbi:MAG: hypothetical protein IJE18_02975, partial [Bacteroidaceae bacterium]|nr:hypothetical protein [Bacteroidaceae bacterium]